MELLTGVIVSLLAQWFKKLGGLESGKAIGLVLVVSLVGSAVVVYFKDTSWWPTILSVVTYAAAFYGLILKQFAKEV